VGKVSTRNTLEQQSKGVSAACISNAEPQISISSGGREVSASSSPHSQNDLQDLASVPKKENVEISDVRLSPFTVTSREVHKCTFSLCMNHNGNSLDYLSINEEANGPSPRSLTPEENESYPEDAVSVPDSDIKDGHLAAVHRAMRKPKKRRLGDMAYEGDADWETLINEQQFLENYQVVESDRSFRTREKSDSSSNSAEAENGGIAAVSAGLKARAAGPVEKIKFKEVLKRKGGLQEYLECRLVFFFFSLHLAVHGTQYSSGNFFLPFFLLFFLVAVQKSCFLLLFVGVIKLTEHQRFFMFSGIGYCYVCFILLFLYPHLIATRHLF
jgi:hypothetical protein